MKSRPICSKTRSAGSVPPHVPSLFRSHDVQTRLVVDCCCQRCCTDRFAPLWSYWRQVEIAGSALVFPLADAWAFGYRARCPRINVTVESGGSTNGALRVCGVLPGGSIVDIAAMPRKLSIPGEVVNATNATAGQFICNRGDTTRKIQQFEVGLDGLTMILASSSLAAQCPRKIPGLTIAQLRLMYSNFSEVQQGLDTPETVKEVIPNSDSNTASRNWRELKSLALLPMFALPARP
jgi:ABC-type phosphate transport system substrate-binding protein